MLWFGGAHIEVFQRVIAEADLPITTYTTEETQRIAAVLMAAKFLAGSLQSLTRYFGARG
jgi:hypothetical protein